MIKNPFLSVSDEIIKDINFYKRAAARYLNRCASKKEIIIKADDVFQQTFCSFYSPRQCKRRRWRTDLPVKQQFLTALKSTAYDMVRKEKTREGYSRRLISELPKTYEPAIESENLEAVKEVLNEYTRWIIENNKVELFFVLSEMMEQKSDDQIAARLDIPVNRVRYIKKEIRRRLREMK